MEKRIIICSRVCSVSNFCQYITISRYNDILISMFHLIRQLHLFIHIYLIHRQRDSCIKQVNVLDFFLCYSQDSNVLCVRNMLFIEACAYFILIEVSLPVSNSTPSFWFCQWYVRHLAFHSHSLCFHTPSALFSFLISVLFSIPNCVAQQQAAGNSSRPKYGFLWRRSKCHGEVHLVI